MKRIKSLSVPFIILVVISILQSVVFGQGEYDMNKVDPASPIVIDGEIDPVWNSVAMEPCVYPVIEGDNTTDPAPEPYDYSIHFGALWDDAGLYFLVRIVDDLLVFNANGTIEWDGTQSPVEWWQDDAFTLLFPNDLQLAGSPGQQVWEFAWLILNDLEVKASYEQQWCLPEQIETAWIIGDNDELVAEVFISWDAFQGSASESFPFEVRGLDDDEESSNIYPQSFLQWNSSVYEVEKDAQYMGMANLMPEYTSVKQISNGIPSAFVLSQNYPNPFNPTTHIDFSLPKSGHTRLQIFNVTGRMVSELVNEVLEAGMHNVTFDAADLPSGLYYYKIESGKFSRMKKMMLIK